MGKDHNSSWYFRWISSEWYKKLRLQTLLVQIFAIMAANFTKKLSLEHISLRKLREARRLTVLPSAMPSESDGEAGFADTIRPHADYGSRLNTDCLIRLVRLRQGCRTHKTSNRQPVFLTPAPCMEFEPPRHSTFVTAHGGKERVAYDPYINSGVVPDTYIALYRGCHSGF